MDFLPTGRLLRMLRIRRNLRQEDVSIKSNLSHAAISRHENGRMGSLPALERHAAVFSLRLDIRLLGRAGALVRLGDEEHAAIVEVIASWFRDAGLETETEGSFSEWGERGRIDLLAFDPLTGTLVVVEVKTQFLDLQDLFGSLNVKERLATRVAERRGWKIRRQTVLLAAADTSANREVVRTHPTLFSAFVQRRLTSAALAGNHRQMLTWVSHQQASRGTWIAGRQRVRRARRVPVPAPDANHAQMHGQDQFSPREPYPDAPLPPDRVPTASSRHAGIDTH